MTPAELELIRERLDCQDKYDPYECGADSVAFVRCLRGDCRCKNRDVAAVLHALDRLRIDLEQERFQRAEAERLLEMRTREYTVLRDWYRVALDRLRELGIDTSGYGSMT